MLELIEIHQLIEKDVQKIKPLQPKGWDDIRPVFLSHLHTPYFFPLKFSIKNEIIGVGELILTKEFAWLGNIIVRNDFQKRGIGKLITQTLMDLAQSKGFENMLLLATAEGKGLYEKFGFEEQGKFIILRKENPLLTEFQSPNIFPIEKVHYPFIFQLDQQATGEDRTAVLKLHLKGGFVFQKADQVEGFFLPTLGNQLTIANNFHAGIELLKFRETFGEQRICLPEENSEIIEYLKKQTYKLVGKSILMCFGEMKNWRPEMIFCRIGGYLG